MNYFSKKNLFPETLWLAGIAIAAYFINRFFNHSDYFNPELSMDDDFYKTRRTDYQLPVFLILAFLVFGTRAVIKKFQNSVTNLIYIFITASLILLITHIILEFDPGWIIYPPLSAIAPFKKSSLPGSIYTLYNILKIIQPVLILILAITSIVTGMNLKKHSTSN